MTSNYLLDKSKRVLVGLSFILFPLVFVFAFATHPGLLSPDFLSAEQIIARARGNGLLQFGHVLVTLNTVLLIVVALHFMKVLESTAAAWSGLVGAAIAIVGAVILAADKGALCLTMSALDTLPDNEFDSMMPGLLAIFAKEGWVVLVWGIILLPLGFAVQAVGLLKSRALPRWQGILFLVGALFIGTPDGAEVINLTAATLLTIAFLPYGVSMLQTTAQSSKP